MYFIDILTELETWYCRDNGQHLLQASRRVVKDTLAMSFGYHILQLGALRTGALIDNSAIDNRIYAGERTGQGVNLLCLPDELPLESDSVDAVVVHHGLEFSVNPHQVLREVQRVLTPHGQLIIVGFNPWSVQGVVSRLRGFSKASLWHQQRFVSESRLTDWLHLLGCEVESSTRLQSLPLFGGRRVRSSLSAVNQWSDKHNLPMGSLYMVHAVKQVTTGNRQKRRLYAATRRRLIGLVPQPAPAPVPSPAPRAPSRRDGDSAA